jgi:hypothetical protein
MDFEVIRQIGYSIGQQGDLDLRRSRIVVMDLETTDDFLF